MIKLKAKNVRNHPHQKHCCIGISLHSTNHTDEKLEAIIEYVNASFEDCIIDLSDTLYAHHYMSAYCLNQSEARSRTKLEGDKWLEHNAHTIKKLRIPYTIIRWNNWINHSDFDQLLKTYYALFEKNSVFHNAVMDDISNYYMRRYGKNIRNMNARFFKTSIAYLLEEITCHTIMFRQHPCTNVYPGKQLECYRVIREGMVPEAPHGLNMAHHTRLNLYISPDAAPQSVSAAQEDLKIAA